MSSKVISVRLSEVALGTFGFLDDPTARVQGAFLFSAATGNANTAMVYFELEPGCRLGAHTDSAEELLIFLQGSARVTVGDAQAQVQAGDVALVPAMVLHGVENIGDEPVRVLGCFSSNTVMSTFEQPLVPLAEMPTLPEAQRTMVTPPPALLELTPVMA